MCTIPRVGPLEGGGHLPLHPLAHQLVALDHSFPILRVKRATVTFLRKFFLDHSSLEKNFLALCAQLDGLENII